MGDHTVWVRFLGRAKPPLIAGLAYALLMCVSFAQ